MARACAVNCTTGAALIFLGLWLVPGTAFAASRGDTHDTVEKTIPQGKDPPGTNEEQRAAALGRDKTIGSFGVAEKLGSAHYGDRQHRGHHHW